MDSIGDTDPFRSGNSALKTLADNARSDCIIRGGVGEHARNIHTSLSNYPIVLTRDINQARDWLRSKARGTERLGLVASSG